jgi:serine/threonine protein kinase
MKNYIPASLEQNLLKALAKKPGKRHISMNSFVEELEMCFSPEIKNYYHRGVLAFEREYFSSAKNYFSRVISIDPKYEEVNDYYKRTLESSKSLEEKPKQETQKKEKEREVFSFTGKVIGEYKIGNRIGKGSQGVVYLSSHIPTSKELAIKFLRGSPGDEDILKRFKDREARALFSLNHNNIVRAVDWIEEPEMGIYGIAMEYIEGLNLKKYISQKGPLSESKTLDIAIKLADGISYAHQKNVIHRDIKSTNILVGNKGGIKLADFGIAQLVSSEKLTRSRQIMGTIEYMSPEQIRGDTNIGVQSDIYSLGIIIYEMLTGNVPFTGNTQHEIQEKQLRQKPVSLKKIIKTIPMKSLENLDKVILSALMKKAYQRPATMELFKQELQNCLKSLTEEKTTIQDNIGRAEQLISQEDYRGAQTILKETLVLQPYNKRATELYERTKIFLRKEKEKAFKIIFMTTIFFLLVAGIFSSNNYNYEKKVFKKFDILVNGKDYASAIK